MALVYVDVEAWSAEHGRPTSFRARVCSESGNSEIFTSDMPSMIGASLEAIVSTKAFPLVCDEHGIITRTTMPVVMGLVDKAFEKRGL